MDKGGSRLDFDRDHVIYDDFLLVRKGTQSCKKNGNANEIGRRKQHFYWRFLLPELSAEG